MRKFQVGDIALGRHYVMLPDRNGMSCEILGPLQLVTALECRTRANTTKLRYHVRWADGIETYAQPHTLRHKPTRDTARLVARQITLDLMTRLKRLTSETQLLKHTPTGSALGRYDQGAVNHQFGGRA